MLLGFTVANVLSLRDEQTLSLVSEGLDDTPARLTGIVAERRPVQALPVVGIYGANASGKSNVLGALRLMRQAVLGFVRWFGSTPRVTPELRALLEADIRAKTAANTGA